MRKLLATVSLLLVLGGATGITAQARSLHDYVYSGLMCIHKYEGSWSANTGNGYYGGLQMDLDFQRSYGRSYLRKWGTADNWSVSAQLEVGHTAYHQRGWYPWPNTARMCGLI